MSVAILHGDCREILPTLGAESVNCCVTSPPYWGLRDYGVTGQIGLESTPEAYVAELVAVFREVRRVLRADGTVWLNLGSSYMGNGPTTGGCSEKSTLSGGGGRYRDGSKAEAMFAASRGSDPILSPRPKRAPSCGSDGTELQGLTDAGSACSGLCDECLDGFLTHRARIADTPQPIERSALPLSQIGRGSEQTDSALPSPGASLPCAQGSTTIESWLQRRGACSRCDARASGLSLLHSSSDDARTFVCTGPHKGGIESRASVGNRTGMDAAGSAWLDYTRRLKHKDLVPIPWLVAMALQADGWYLRSDIIWAKPNPMPESVTDRPTKAHEYVFLLTKSARYWYDAGAISEPSIYAGDVKDYTGDQKNNDVDADLQRTRIKGRKLVVTDTRNARTVWTIATQPFSGAHFATMPPKLAERCILAGCPEGGTVLDPFGGAGTTGLVADRLGRNAVLIELNPSYAGMADRRIVDDAPLFAGGAV